MRADRLISMLMLLQTRGKLTTQVLAHELGVSRRTVLRDIEALSFSGIPIHAEGGHGGGVALDENYRTTLIGLKESEIRALFIANNSPLLREIGLGDAAESTLLKLSAALPVRHQPTVDFIRQRLYIDPLWWWHDSQPPASLTTLQEAVYTDRCVRALYENWDGDVLERVLEPYSLVAKSSLWYLVARRDLEFRTYRVSRFREIVTLGAHFERMPDFDLQSYWESHLHEFAASFSAYEFTLRVHPDRLNFVRWLTPGRHTVVESHADGWLTLHIQLDAPELAQMLVIGLGAQGEVIAPDSLIDTVRAACLTMLDSLPKIDQHGG